MSGQPQLGLPEVLRPAAAALYWQAFGPKLGRVLGPEPRALQFLTRVMRADQALVVCDGTGALLGLAGFKTPQGSFAGGSKSDLVAVYGVAGAAWRGALLGLLGSEAPDEALLIDGICVAPSARGRGIGSALIAALCAEAARRGHPSVRLDVVDTNLRAMALYDRLGFQRTRRQGIGALRFVFGFNSAVTMVRALKPGL